MELEKVEEALKAHYEYNPEMLSSLENMKKPETENRQKMITVRELIFGMSTNQDIRAKNGMLLVKKGQEITYPVIARLQNFNVQVGVEEPFEVIVPVQEYPKSL